MVDNEDFYGGSIYWLKLNNFLSHKKFSINFSPSMNLISGRNGSGKSAILIAIGFALGGKALDTNRFRTAGDYITDGEKYCVVELSICNRGKFPFKQELYGETIEVERKILKTGSSTIRIRNGATKAVVAKTMKELSQIRNYFNIQPNNPFLFMHQDNSKEYLRKISPSRLYELFMKLTRFEETEENYEKTKERLEEAGSNLCMKESSLEEGKRMLAEKKKEYDDIENLRNLEKERSELFKRFCWTVVLEKEKSRDEHARFLQIRRTDANKLRKKLDETEKQKFSLEERSEKLREEASALENKSRRLSRELDDFSAKLSRLGLNIQKVQRKIENFKREISKIDMKVHNLRKEISEYEEVQRKGIEELRTRLLDEKKDFQIEQSRLETKIREIKNKKVDSEERKRKRKLEYGALVDRKRLLENDTHRIGKEINKLIIQSRGTLGKFGNDVSKLAGAVKNGTIRFEKLPIGPIGGLLRVLDPTWSNAIEKILSFALRVFLCETGEDVKKIYSFNRGEFKRIPLVRMKFRSKYQNIDLIPRSERYTRMIDTISTSSEVAFNFLIDRYSIERVCFVKTNREYLPYQLLAKLPTNIPIHRASALSDDLKESIGDVQVVTMDGAVVRNFSVSQNFSAPGNLGKLLDVDYSSLIERKKMEIERIKRYDIPRTEESRKEKLIETRTVNEEIQGCQDELEKLSSCRMDINVQVEDLDTKLKNLKSGDGLETLQDEEARNLETLEIYAKNSEELNAEISKMKEEHETTNRTLNDTKTLEDEIKSKIDGKNSEISRITRDIEEKVREIHAINTDLTIYNDDITEKEKIIERAEADILEKVQKTESKFGSERVFAFDENGRMRGSDAIELEIIDLRKRIHSSEAQRGKTLKQIHDGYRDIKNKIIKITSQLRKERKFIEELKVTHERRCKNYVEYRDNVCEATIIRFLRYLEAKNHGGSLLFNHEKRTIEISLDLNKHKNRGSTTTSDMHTLSGGEGAYSTLCLVLSLWGIAPSPICGIDEFDCFMDDGTREMSLDMFAKAMAEDNNGQILILSPRSSPEYDDMNGFLSSL